MPREAGIDVPGALHHIIVRGIESRKIFFDNSDRDHFLERLGVVLAETRTPCFAWTLIPKPKDVLAPCKYAQSVKARSLLCYWMLSKMALANTLDKEKMLQTFKQVLPS